MNYNDLIESTKKSNPPSKLFGIRLAVWHILKDDWDMAHNIAQDIKSKNASWVHAYLHRQEGDIGNAHYWYRIANKNPYSGSLKIELDDIIASVFNQNEK